MQEGASAPTEPVERELIQPELVDGDGAAAAVAQAGDAAEDAATEQITSPTKLIRIASMVRTMLDEVRRAPLDDAGRRRLREIHEKSLDELEGVLSPDLQQELSEVVLPLTDDTPSESELRLAQAQLVGWLEGLFHGIQATLFTQQAMAQSQFEEMRRRRALEPGGIGAPQTPRRRRADTCELTVGDWSPDSWRVVSPRRSSPTGPTRARSTARSTNSARCRRWCSPARPARSPRRSATRPRAARFVLQAGDCAESFDAFSANTIRDKLKVILQMAVVLTYGSGVPTVKIGRIAGQFAKPRSSPTETREGIELPSFRGDMVNDFAFDAAARAADPARLVRVYHQSASTLNLLRAFAKGGFADLSRVHAWNLEYLDESPEGRRYDALAAEIDRALRFMAACGIDLAGEHKLHEVDFYTSHEALILGYEEALTRQDTLTGDWYDCSAHLVWIGERTRQLDGAHVEFHAGIKNPVGVKLGPSTAPDEVLSLCERLNPDGVPGRLTFVCRMGGEPRVRVAPAAARRRACERSPGGVDVRPDARQRLHPRQRLQDPRLPRRDAGAARVLRRLRRHRRVARGCPHRAHRGERHRMHRWEPRGARATISSSATRRSATPASTHASRSTSRSRPPSCCAADSGRPAHPTRDDGVVTSFEAFGPNSGLVEELYQRYLADPASVDAHWRDYFAGVAPRTAASPLTAPRLRPHPLPHRRRREARCSSRREQASASRLSLRTARRGRRRKPKRCGVRPLGPW